MILSHANNIPQDRETDRMRIKEEVERERHDHEDGHEEDKDDDETLLVERPHKRARRSLPTEHDEVVDLSD